MGLNKEYEGRGTGCLVMERTKIGSKRRKVQEKAGQLSFLLVSSQQQDGAATKERIENIEYYQGEIAKLAAEDTRLFNRSASLSAEISERDALDSEQRKAMAALPWLDADNMFKEGA